MLVLRHLAEHFRPPDVDKLDTPFDIPGLSFEKRVAPALRRLAEAEPPYIKGVEVDETDYPLVVTGLTERGWEAARAGEDPGDTPQSGAPIISPPVTVGSTGTTFQVALSFAGQQRSYVQQVAHALAALGIHYS